MTKFLYFHIFCSYSMLSRACVRVRACVCRMWMRLLIKFGLALGSLQFCLFVLVNLPSPVSSSKLSSVRRRVCLGCVAIYYIDMEHCLHDNLSTECVYFLPLGTTISAHRPRYMHRHICLRPSRVSTLLNFRVCFVVCLMSQKPESY